MIFIHVGTLYCTTKIVVKGIVGATLERASSIGKGIYAHRLSPLDYNQFEHDQVL